jgi:hypothetical protein
VRGLSSVLNGQPATQAGHPWLSDEKSLGPRVRRDERR